MFRHSLNEKIELAVTICLPTKITRGVNAQNSCSFDTVAVGLSRGIQMKASRDSVILGSKRQAFIFADSFFVILSDCVLQKEAV